MKIHNVVTCMIVGEGSLPQKCMDILKEYGLQIKALVSADEGLLNENKSQPFPVFSNLDDLTIFEPVDYIFSINNSLILRKSFTSLAKIMAINYHDAPLPSYAGMYATNWAILNDESEHGVSWHEVIDKIDAGDIVASQSFPLLPNDTALSLNTRCFEAALQSFGGLVQSIVENKLTPVQQNLANRTYYSYASRPSQFGLITHEMSAKYVDALIRATNFSSHFNNEFALPLLWIHDQYFIVAQASVNFEQTGNPGYIIDYQGDIGFYCLDGLFIPELIYDINGKEAAIEEIFAIGFQMKIPDCTIASKALTHFGSLAKYEPFWRKQLAKADFLPWPLLDGEPSGSITRSNISSPSISKLEGLFPDQSIEDIVTAVFLIFLLKISNQSFGTVGYIFSGLTQDIKDLEGFFNPWLPLNGTIDDTNDAVTEVKTALQNIYQAQISGTFLRSTRIRYPELRNNASELPAIILSAVSGEPLSMSAQSIIVSISKNQIDYHIPNGKKFQGAVVLAECFEMFLENLVQSPNQPISQIELLSRSKKLALTKSVNQVISEPNLVNDVVDQFLVIAKSFSHQTAIYDSVQNHSYRSFKSDIEKLSAKLIQLGILPDQVVAVAIDRNYNYFVAILAILRCGAGFLPLDPALPSDRKKFFCEDSGISLLLTDQFNGDLEDFFPHLDVTGIRNSDQLPCPSIAYHPDSVAYIIYTSGSTGVPKGVKISRKALANFISGALGLYQFSSGDHVLQFSNLAFDASIEEIFTSFCSGSSLYLRTAEMLQADELLNFTVTHKISVWDLPTAFWRQLMQSNSYQNTPLPECLRMVIIGGEAVTNNDIALWNAGKSNCRLMNTYGPTETTVVALAFEINPGYLPEKSVPIGLPLPGYKLYITNPNRQLVPKGVAGELLVAGDSLAIGYINREQEQNSAFIWLETPDSGLQRCYCTGDLVSVGKDGQIHYEGRIDAQVKIRGYRVEPGEIEQQIASIEGIESSVVVVHVNDAGEKSLYAFFTTSDGITDAPAIKAFLKQRLPAFMVPEMMLKVDEIPLTGNGKVDKKRLLLLAREYRKVSTNGNALPTNESEEYLLTLWKNILNVTAMGIDDDFFDLGGHSLKAVQLMAEIKKQKEINIPLASLIQNSTVRKFAPLLSSPNKDVFWQCLVPIRPAGTKTPLFLIHGAGLNILLYQSLSHYLKKDRPIYAFQAKGLDGSHEFSNDLEEMADDYIGEIKKIQPNGPYMLLGFSLGGFIAFDMAKKLAIQGNEISFAGVIDSVSSEARHIQSPLKLFLFNIKVAAIRPFYVFWLLLKEPMDGKRQFIKNKYRSIRFSLMFALIKMGILREKERKIKIEDGQPMFLADNVEMAMTEALVKYKLSWAPIEIDLFKAGFPKFYIPYRGDYGWSRFAGKGVVVHTLPSEHSKIFAPPNDKHFAEVLDQRLDEIEAIHFKQK